MIDMSDYEFAIRQDERRMLLECRRIARIKRNRARHITTLRKVKNTIQLILGAFLAMLGFIVCRITTDYTPMILILPVALATIPRRWRARR